MEPSLSDDIRERRGLVLTDSMIMGLFFIQRYRFLAIDQYARAASVKRATASD